MGDTTKKDDFQPAASQKRIYESKIVPIGGESGIRTLEGLHPTRFPSARHRPLGELSTEVSITGSA